MIVADVDDMPNTFRKCGSVCATETADGNDGGVDVVTSLVLSNQSPIDHTHSDHYTKYK